MALSEEVLVYSASDRLLTFLFGDGIPGVADFIFQGRILFNLSDEIRFFSPQERIGLISLLISVF